MFRLVSEMNANEEILASDYSKDNLILKLLAKIKTII